MSVYIVRCHGCKAFTLLLGALFLEGHVYCHDCKPEGSVAIEAALLAFVIDPIETREEQTIVDSVIDRMRNNAQTS